MGRAAPDPLARVEWRSPTVSEIESENLAARSRSYISQICLLGTTLVMSSRSDIN